MKFFLNVSITFLMLLSSSSIFPQTLSKEERKILELQDKRTLGDNDALLNYLESADSGVVLKALNALANIADSISVYKTSPFLDGLYENKNASGLLEAYAFYLGQTNCADSKEKLSLLTYGTNENVYKSFPEIINALSKTGEESDMNYMINIISSDMTGEKFGTEVYRSLAMSIARFALRRIKNETSVDALKQMANNEDSLIQRNIAFAFWRTGDKKLLDTAKQEIYHLTESADAQTRMWAVNAAGKLQDKLLLMFMLESFSSEKDWRVKVNMLNTLTNYNLDSVTELNLRIYSVLGDAIGGENEHVSLTGLSVLGKLFADARSSKNTVVSSLADNIMEEIRYGLDSVDEISWRQKSELANSMSLIYKDEVKDDLFRAFSRTKNYDLKAGILKAFGNFNDGMIYKEVRDTLTAEVKRYNEKNPEITGELIGSGDLAKLYRGFVEMLSNLDDKVDEENQNTIRLIFTEFISSKDAVITDICFSSLKDSLYSKYSDETASVIAFDYGELAYPEDYDVMLIFIDAMKDLNNESTKAILKNNLLSENYEIAKSSADALEKITESKYEFAAKPRYDFDWNYMEGLSQKKKVILKTIRGDIKIELMPDVAPFTVMNFLKLAENNFYDGTIFHRVVSNFVIQGGDPTGTGYGSPGYTIRSEFSPLTYETGMVGMASSGKDTEGSQFFITHSATPHLDGRYTIFGKVTEGMDVVDEIMIGDFIEDVVIE